jgi:protein-disulfide isomerase
MRRFFNFTCLVMLAASIAASQTESSPKAAAKSPNHESLNVPSEATVDSFLQQTFGYNSAVSWKIASIKPVAGVVEVTVVLATPQGQQLSKFFVTPDGQHAITGEIIPFGAKPFARDNTILEKGVNGPERGPKDAPVTIVEFGDLQCPACRAAQPTIQQLVQAEPNARFVFQNFPLPELHNWAMKGASYADCVAHASNDAFWKFLDTVYTRQPEITAENVDEKLTEIANESGVNGEEIAVCAAKPETRAHVDASIALGKDVDVTGTPTLFINGRRIGNVESQMLDIYKQLVDFAAKETK